MGEDPRMRIAVCGYLAEMPSPPEGWTALHWQAQGGMGNQGDGRGKENRTQEVVWFSPFCLSGREARQLGWEI